MKAWTSSFGVLQKIGKSLMLPVSVLPVAGILLGVGSSLHGHFEQVAAGQTADPWALTVFLAQSEEVMGFLELMSASGSAIFSALPLLFALGVVIGLAAGDGVAALAATVGYVVLLATMGVIAELRGLPTTSILGLESLDTGVFGGILIGGVAAVLFNRYYRIQLPPYLGFFAGKRFVPIATAFAAMAVGVVLSFLWPPVGRLIALFSDWVTGENTALAVFLYGLVERSLLPFGLHHIWNVPFFFQIGSFTTAAGQVVTGDVPRFLEGDPTAGILGGAYLFKMFGLPAAALAIWHCAKPEKRALIGGIMMSAALTSFLTGITEPVEFSFMFVAPPLYALHALLAGCCFALFNLCGGLIGTTFSHGLIDFAILSSKATRPWLLFALGLPVGALYYTLFRFVITRYDLKTPGREDSTAGVVSTDGGAEGTYARQLVLAFGGRSNIVALDACITRLRVTVREPKLASSERLKGLGASGVVRVGQSLQAIFGPLSENLKTDMEQYLASAGDDADLAPAERENLLSDPAESSAQGPLGEGAGLVDPEAGAKAVRWLEALGGGGNVVEVEACAQTRVRVRVRAAEKVDRLALESDGVQAVMENANGVFHLITGSASPSHASALKQHLEGRGAEQA